MEARPFQALQLRARRTYVGLMFQVMGRALQAMTEVDGDVCRDTRELPPGFLFEMRVLPSGPGLIMEHTEHGHLRFLGNAAPRPVNLSIQFKHMVHAFRVVSFQEKTAVAFANERMLVDGDIGYAVRMTRVLNRLETFILPEFLAARAVKQYPADLRLAEKAQGAARIYLRVVTNLFAKASPQ
ncbi:MAG: hypothetical protein ACQEW7_05950 [Pseudomonadota bacterium]